MLRIPQEAKPGDWLAVDTGDSWGNRAIRFGQWFNDVLDWRPGRDLRYARVNHVIQVSHWSGSVLQGIEGRPGGVGYVDLTSREWRHMSIDLWCPKSDADRAFLVEWGTRVAFGSKYDWTAIEKEVLDFLGIPKMWEQPSRGDGVPGNVICSTAWTWARVQRGIAVPDVPIGKPTTPRDVHLFNLRVAT